MPPDLPLCGSLWAFLRDSGGRDAHLLPHGGGCLGLSQAVL